MAITALIV